MATYSKKERGQLIAKLKNIYDEFNSDSLQQLAAIYHEDITFQDPVLQVNGLADLETYFAHGIANAQSCRFTFDTEMFNKDEAFLTWQMRLQHESLANGREIVVQGSTHLQFTDEENKIRSHVDYYDLGAMVYEHIPVISFLIRKVRDRLQAVS
ncbi:nuclear transport factor 2 family protein [Aliidiomarina sp.]|uniref:nuclear transport factor 2 family protein n=1 Tax=Aliidiomarina sp. TaxID=1872439 RepID=UPI003A4E566E